MKSRRISNTRGSVIGDTILGLLVIAIGVVMLSGKLPFLDKVAGGEQEVMVYEINKFNDDYTYFVSIMNTDGGCREKTSVMECIALYCSGVEISTTDIQTSINLLLTRHYEIEVKCPPYSTTISGNRDSGMLYKKQDGITIDLPYSSGSAYKKGNVTLRIW